MGDRTRVAVLGAAGRMGQMLIQAIALSEYTLFNIVMTAAAIYYLPELAEEFFNIA